MMPSLSNQSALDWSAVLDRLAFHASTLRGAAAARAPDFAPTQQATLDRYSAVAEVLGLEDMGETVPIGAILDVGEAVDQASRGLVLEGPELLRIGTTLKALDHLYHWLAQRSEDVPHLFDLVGPIRIDPELKDRLEVSFEPTGELSEQAYPEIRSLRKQVRDLQSHIRTTLEGLIKGDALGDALQDRFITERGGRYVIPVRSSRRSGLGIVHDTSQSGETVFVEPTAVVESHNALREAEAALRREISRVLAALSRLVGRFRGDIAASLEAALQVDLAVARAKLGREWDGCIPTVGHEGVLNLVAARHPVLQLRGVAVVANDLRLDSTSPGLVFTGPNTGGKTIAMKTLGLAALLVRAAIPIPAADTSRVDFFHDVLADVGDRQSVAGDLSTFSGHVLMLKEVLDGARPHVLVLLDEVAAGTDPAQGAALACAVLEAVVDAGARIAVTTHYAELKAMGVRDTRFMLAGLQYHDGLPTYRVQIGLPGQSHALSVARHLGLDPRVLARARALLDTGNRDLSDLMEQLEQALSQARAQQTRLELRQIEQARAENELQQRSRELERRRANLMQDIAAGFQAYIRERETEVKGLIAALQRHPDLSTAGRTLEQLRAVRDEVRTPAPEPTPPPPPDISVGDRIHVRPLQRQGTIIQVLGERVEVEVGALRTWVLRDALEPVPAGGGAPRKESRQRGRRAERQPRPRPTPADEAPYGGVPTTHNTCDLRGKRVDEALDAVTALFDRLVLAGEPAAFILHGHGTGALKQAVRQWLPESPYVQRWRPGTESEGGDAWTVAELK